MCYYCGMKLSRDFFNRRPIDVAHDLVGAYLCRVMPNGEIFRASIVELELYTQEERACHAYNGRRGRCDAMFMSPGHAYVYLCYGLHNMLNIVLGDAGYAAAVLIRALDSDGCNGPGKLTRVMEINCEYNKMDLCAPNSIIWLESSDAAVTVDCGTRIGIDYAGADTKLPWRFAIAQSPYLSCPL